MKKMLLAVGCMLAATVPSTAKHLSEFGIAGDATEIRRTVAGTTCRGPSGSILNFGNSTPESPGTFTRVGRAPGTYQIGYGTLLVERDGKLHSHVVSVSLQGGEFYLGGEKYRCELATLGPAIQ
jgi:hypothetical protein